MVPNFLAHPSFSWDGKGKRFHEALNHDFLNASEMNCTFYGRDVPDWRFAKGEGKEEVTEETKPTKEPEIAETKEEKKFPGGLLAGIIAGLAALGAAAYIFLKKKA